MILLSKYGNLCSLQCKYIIGFFRCFPQRQIHYTMLIHKRVQIFACLHSKSMLQYRFQSSNRESNQDIKNSATLQASAGSKLSQRARLKQAVRDYGATIIVFHVAISLTSLGICYIAISNGIDAVSLLHRIGFPDSIISSKVVVGSGTFVMAYAVHKLFAPARIAITLSSAPFIVRYLRKINWLKSPPK